MSKLRVLIADDHPVMRVGLKALLAAAPDIDVVGEASDGEEALRAITDLRPDVVVMDLSMKPMDGLTALRALGRRGDAPPVLALTMHDERDYLVPALEAGALGYIVKSAASTELLDAVRTVARGVAWVRPSAAPLLASRVSRRSDRSSYRDRYETLSDREREVFVLLAHGHTTTGIGERLHLSPKTVDTYRRRVNSKLEVTERADYVRVALELGLMAPPP
ncbi:MAG: response regulator transcription factor [Alphaproteobacteria bacterium]|nr:response regulator transcription factor [Alphaproteobacteria bacterium]